MSLDPFNLNDYHSEVRKRIDAGEPGLAQINLGQIVSIACRNGHCSLTGSISPEISLKEVLGEIMDDLVDDSRDQGTKASRSGVFSKNDFLNRAVYYETRYLFPTRRDKEFAKKIRTFAESW